MFTACGIMHRRCCRPVAGNIVGALYHKLSTQSSVPEDGRNYRPKPVELIGIINKLLLLHLVGCLYYCLLDLINSNVSVRCKVFLKLRKF